VARKPSLSKRLREARVSRGMPVAEVAEQVGVTTAAIYLWEAGRVRPRFENLRALCKVLRLPIGSTLDIAGY
jgi:transcriptional regulator with XRE-family HTH domain